MYIDNKDIISKTQCFHCGSKVMDKHEYKSHIFCCQGCKTVFQLLEENNLSNFYSFDSKPGNKPETKDQKFEWLKETEVQESLYHFFDGKKAVVMVQLPNIHCSACIFLLENLRQLHKGILSSEVNFTQKKAKILFEPEQVSLHELATLLQKIGYTPYFSGESEKKNEKILENSLIKKLTVAGFFFGNIMLLSFPEYLGGENLEDRFGQFFGHLMLILSIPVLFYSSSPYLITAYKSIKTKQLNLDIPIAIGIIALFGRSTYEVLSQTGAGYFDSFTGFIFFLLLGRWFQNKTYASIDFEKNIKSHLPLAVQVIQKEDKKYTSIDKIKKDDVIELKNGEIIPADGTLISNYAHFDFSFITGESEPIAKKKGEKIYAGAKNIGQKVLIKIKTGVDHSYLSGLWKGSSENLKRKSWKKRDKKLTFWFLAVLGLVVSISTVAWSIIQPGAVALVVTSILIVACPCALALSAPFTFGNVQRILGEKGLYLKDSYLIPELAKATDIVFDKTGTLTLQNHKVYWKGEALNNSEIIHIKALCSESKHPYSKAIVQYLNIKDVDIKVDNFKEIPGEGIEAKFNKNIYEIKRYPEKDSASALFINGKLKGYFSFSSAIDPQVPSILKVLSEKFQLHLISGDGYRDKDLFKGLIPIKNMHFHQSPYDKEKFIESLQKEGRTVIMIGDGVNDTAALQKSDLGFTLTDSNHQFTPAADAIIQRSSMNHIFTFLKFGKYSLFVLKILFIFSLTYNTLGLYFAVSNQLTPLIAAIIMPLSSISVVLLATLLTRLYPLR